MSDKLTELDTKKVLTSEEEIAQLQEILKIAERISDRIQIVHARVTKERNANK